LAGLYGIPPQLLPPDWTAFADYNAEMHASNVLTVSAAARTIADYLIERTSIPTWYWAFTGQLLPVRLRQEFGLEYGPITMSAAMLSLSGIKRTYRLLPARLRQVGPLQEAQARLRGRASPDLPTQLLNAVWIGRRSLPGA
jgi:uncharacterized protein (DUF2236 family)